ncbi:hypothetical protein [Wolbachia endosymbiont (group A) of Acrocera orbiculus]|uniref:Uncharacterized protein n=1 Tax=Wolbachia endosymbiont of Sergentomyia squamirostris TaxID=3113640 RepID=A0AAT9GD29_9RICK|nr:hypothetical protein [Wolbachia endosymbiont (group A) of Acrocera orbiculus]
MANKVEQSKTTEQNRNYKLPIKLLEDEKATASQEELFSQSDIQKAIAVEQAKKREVQSTQSDN